MDDAPQDKQVGLGVFARRGETRGLSNAELIALALSALWIGAVALFFFTAGRSDDGGAGDPFRVVMVLVSIFMPIALIWIAATAANSARVMREESARLQAAVDSMRQNIVAQRQADSTSVAPSVEKKLDELVEAQRKAGEAFASFQTIRAEKPAIPIEPAQVIPDDIPDSQPSLALGTRADEAPPPVSVEDFIRALNFPENADDKEGFRALRRAMADRKTAELVQASQDILTLLSQEGIYMDDMHPDRARPEIWRRFAQGERGRTVAGLGGIRDRSALTLTAARMRQDHIFRDTAHHFLRRFDQTLSAFEKTASDLEIADLTDTRTARAFMLLGRVAGTFD
ncbi:MAG: hypothetical protein AAFR35_00140 [Pseudomonadota bacterium]